MSNQLIEAQRYEIYLGLQRKWSETRIAKEIGGSKSTVCREIRRNAKTDGSYVWKQAQAKCDSRKHGFKGNRRKPDELWWRIDRMIEEDWSPGQIAGVLRKEGVHVCKQTIYNHVHADTTGKLARHMPHELKYTRRLRRQRPVKATNIANRTSIHERPAEADGKRFGDWEMDTIVDSYGHAILTLTERSTNFILMERLKEGRKAVPTAKTVVRLLFPYRKYVRTITTDNGCEFAAHLDITKGLTTKGGDKVIVYFADSYSAWQKGTIENANKLIRKYIPKKLILTILRMYTSRKFSTNSIEGQEKSYNLIHLNCAFSKIFCNVALAVGLCTKKKNQIRLHFFSLKIVCFQNKVYICTTKKCGSSSVGRASASQAEGRGFESRLPLCEKEENHHRFSSFSAYCKF